MNIKTIPIILLLTLFSCESNNSYPWLVDTSYEDVLKQAGDKLVLLDFETEW